MHRGQSTVVFQKNPATHEVLVANFNSLFSYRLLLDKLKVAAVGAAPFVKRL
jgi:hypothetical protein